MDWVATFGTSLACLDSLRASAQRWKYRRGETDEQATSDICLRTVRPHARLARRLGPARGHRLELHRLATSRYLLAHAAIQGVRDLGNVALEPRNVGQHRRCAVHCHPGVPVARLSPRLFL